MVTVKENSRTDSRAYGLGDAYQNLDSSTDGILNLKVPIGCKIGYQIKGKNKLSIEKAFTVSNDLIITENLKTSTKLFYMKLLKIILITGILFQNQKKSTVTPKIKGFR